MRFSIGFLGKMNCAAARQYCSHCNHVECVVTVKSNTLTANQPLLLLTGTCKMTKNSSRQNCSSWQSNAN